ncbi:MAG: NYN domain-containing protein [Clostridium sp.]|nr:NYN domain-containing protein [Clostridium sp.]MCM1207494.1 NYN domain-containing protein [Ruminococcus sp.]
MDKVLFYVDAENVSKSQVDMFMADAMKLTGNCGDFVGKFYGARAALNSLIEYYLNLGLEYVETSVLTTKKKNLTDMKMVVDCLYDVLCTYSGHLKAVYVLSNDCDFNPLVYKLKSLGIPITFAAVDSFNCISTLNELSHYLTARGFFPVSKENATAVLYEYVVDMIANVSLDKTIVLVYLRNKIERLLRGTCTKFGIEYEGIDDGSVMTYSFWEYNHWLKLHGFTDEFDNLSRYTQKIFGSSLTKQDMESILEQGS